MQEVDLLVACPRARAGRRGCSTSGAARVATPTSWPAGAIVVHGIDISEPFVELAAPDAPAGATFERLDARALPFDAEFDAVDLPVPGRVRADDGADGDDDAGPRRDRPGAATRVAALALSAFNAYFAVRTTSEPTFDAATRCQPRAHRGARRPGPVVEVDLWTGCYTPRELRLLPTGPG